MEVGCWGGRGRVSVWAGAFWTGCVGDCRSLSRWWSWASIFSSSRMCSVSRVLCAIARWELSVWRVLFTVSSRLYCAFRASHSVCRELMVNP